MQKLLMAAVGMVSLGLLWGAQEGAEVDVVQEYRLSYAAEDRGWLARVWLGEPGRILGIFDGDLEGGLAAWEKGGEGHAETTEVLFERALWGASVASEATGRRVFADYAGAFVSWDAEQRKSFRAGQRAFGASRQAQSAEDWKEGLAQGRDCRVRAMALGDWWGAAMGYMAEGTCLHGLGRHEEAAAALGLARMINQDLGLEGAELGAAAQLAKCLAEMGAGQRALAAIDGAVTLAQKLEQGAAVQELEALRVQLLEK